MESKKKRRMDGLIEFIHIQIYKEKSRMIVIWFIYAEINKENTYVLDLSHGLFDWMKNLRKNTVFIELLFNIHHQHLIDMRVYIGSYALGRRKRLIYRKVSPSCPTNLCISIEYYLDSKSFQYCLNEEDCCLEQQQICLFATLTSTNDENDSCAWQKAQLFRQSIDHPVDDEQSHRLQISVTLVDRDAI